MKTLLALFLLIPSLTWGDKIAFTCTNLGGYFVLEKGVFTTTLINYREDNSLTEYKKISENDVFINFEVKKIENNKITDGLKSFFMFLFNKEPYVYNKLTKEITRGDKKFYCSNYGLTIQ